MNNTKLGEEIKRLRKEKMLTIKELAKLSGVSEVSITNYENGKSVPSLVKLKKLSKFLNCKFDYLFNLRKGE